MQGGEYEKLESIISSSQKMEVELKKVGLKVKHHEDNLRYLRTQVSIAEQSILDAQVVLGKFPSSDSTGNESQNIVHKESEIHTLEHIAKQEKTAASIVCKMKIHHKDHASKMPVMKDILGVVVTLCKLKDDKLSRIVSEYLGLETILAIVCKTYEGVRALEEYDKNGNIDKYAGLHGLGPSIGTPLHGRFGVICLENLRPYTGEFVAGDPQKRLALLKPKLPDGDCPSGFLGFAVNMIELEDAYLSCVTPNGHGLRETLFYYLLYRLQVYETKAHMQRALPYISDGALSLDGGIVKNAGFFKLGNREDLEIRFPVSSGISSQLKYITEAQEQVRLLGWKKERLAEDMQREELLLNHVKNLFDIKKQEVLKNISETGHYLAQNQVLAPQKQARVI